MSLIYVGKVSWRYRCHAIAMALSVLWAALRGYEIAGYDYSNAVANDGGCPIIQGELT